MAGKVTWSAWQKLLMEDLDWLRALPKTLERDHVVQILEYLGNGDEPLARAYFDAIPAPWPSP